MRDVYLTADVAEASLLLDKAIAGCLFDEVAEIRSLGHTLERWKPEILTHHRTGASNAGAECLNSRIEAIRVSARGYRNREHFKTAIRFHLGGLQLYPITP